VGKTTAIRELSRLLADDLQRRVVIVDTSNEIGGDGDVPHAGIGRARRMQVRLQHVFVLTDCLEVDSAVQASTVCRLYQPCGFQV
jgi:stage III sporulation protein SpoIIIAA